MSPKTSSASKSNLSQFESISLLGFLSEWSCVGLVCVGLMRRASRWMESNTKVACSVLGTCSCRGPLVNSPTSPLIGRQKVETFKLCRYLVVGFSVLESNQMLCHNLMLLFFNCFEWTLCAFDVHFHQSGLKGRFWCVWSNVWFSICLIERLWYMFDKQVA